MKGFSLLEIMVVVVIISIMSGSVVIGFNSFGQTVRLQETAGVITDLVKNLELGMIRRDYVKQTIHFEPDYLVMEAEAENQSPDLSLSWSGHGNCGTGEELAIENKSLESIYLAKRDEYDNDMEINTINPSTSEAKCITFKDSEEIEWQYQLFEGGNSSQILRFLHFNIRRGDDNNLPVIDQGPPTYTLEMTAPYAGKTFYKNGIPTTDPVTLTISNEDSSEIITLQE